MRKGSYTIEASLMIPLLLFTMAIGMKAGLVLYTEIATAQEQEKNHELWGTEDFYKSYWMKEVLND